MILILLSLGAIYAFIPVIIIIILLLAARGSIGRDFFEIFGIASLVGWTKGIAAGGAGRGIGIGRGYNRVTGKSTEKVVGAVGEAGAFYGKYSNKNELDKRIIMSMKMKSDEVRQMLKLNGLEKETANMDDAARVDYAVRKLSLGKVNDYYTKYVEPKKAPGNPPPLKAPSGSAYGGGVGMAVADFYKNYYKGRRGYVNNPSELNEKLRTTNAMSTEQLNGLLKDYKINVPSDMTKERLVRLAVSSLSLKRINMFKESSELFKKKEAAPVTAETKAPEKVAQQPTSERIWKTVKTYMNRYFGSSKTEGILQEPSKKEVSGIVDSLMRNYKGLSSRAKAATKKFVNEQVGSSIKRYMKEYLSGSTKEQTKRQAKSLLQRPEEVGRQVLTQRGVVEDMKKNGWMMNGDVVNARWSWMQGNKGKYVVEDSHGYSNKSYKIFVQPKAEYLNESISKVTQTLDKMITSGEISGIKFKFAKSASEYETGFDAAHFNKGANEKIVIYANSAEDMAKVVKALNSTFKEDVYKYGSETKLDAYDGTHGAKYTYGINPLIHVRRGGRENHVKINKEKQSRGEDVSKPDADWAISKSVISDLRNDSSKKAPKGAETAVKTGKKEYSIDYATTSVMAAGSAVKESDRDIEVVAPIGDIGGYGALISYLEAKVESGNIKEATANELKKAADNYKRDTVVGDKIYNSMGAALLAVEGTSVGKLDSKAKELVDFFGDKEIASRIKELTDVVKSHFGENSAVAEVMRVLIFNTKLDQDFKDVKHNFVMMYSGLKRVYGNYDNYLDFLAKHGVDTPKVMLKVATDIVSEISGVKYKTNGYYDVTRKDINLKYDAEDSTVVHELSHAAQAKNEMAYFEKVDTPEKRAINDSLIPLLHEGGAVFAQKLYETKETWGEAFDYKFMVGASSEHAGNYLKNSDKHTLVAWSGELYELFKKSKDIHKDLYNIMKDENQKSARNKYGIGLALANLLYAANNFDEKMTMKDLNGGTQVSQKVVEKLEKAIKADKDEKIIISLLQI